MRLIDADELLSRLRRDPLFDLVEPYGIEGVIIAAPTIEEEAVIIEHFTRNNISKIEDHRTGKEWALVRRGRWKYKDDDVFAGEYACSNCNGRAEVDLYGQWILSKFCPNCGAKMEED